MKKNRQMINDIDQEIVRLLEERYRCIDEIVQYKQSHHLEVLDESREEEVLSNIRRWVVDKHYEAPIVETFIELMAVSKNYQNQKTIRPD